MKLDQEHPRIRGENPPLGPYPAPITGTSPHTRGKQLLPYIREHEDRNIPAYAGKTAV